MCVNEASAQVADSDPDPAAQLQDMLVSSMVAFLRARNGEGEVEEWAASYARETCDDQAEAMRVEDGLRGAGEIFSMVKSQFVNTDEVFASPEDERTGLLDNPPARLPPTQDRSLSPIVHAHIRDLPLYLLCECILYQISPELREIKRGSSNSNF